jgi:hypothetical protein
MSPTKQLTKLCENLPTDPSITPKYDIFCGALRETGLITVLPDFVGDTTIFPPTDAAFEKLKASLPPGEFDALSKGDLTDILLTHVFLPPNVKDFDSLKCEVSTNTVAVVGDVQQKTKTLCTVEQVGEPPNDVIKLKDKFQIGEGNNLFGAFPKVGLSTKFLGGPIVSLGGTTGRVASLLGVDNVILPKKLGIEFAAMAAESSEPTESPTVMEEEEETNRPTLSTESPTTTQPTMEPTVSPTEDPTRIPLTDTPTVKDTDSPTTDAPVVDPTEAPVDPTEAPIVDPTEAPVVDPTPAPVVDPTESPVDPTEAPVDPTPAPVDPTESPVDPTESRVDPTESPVDPTVAPVDPTEAPVDPTEAPVDPTDEPVADPTEDPNEEETRPPISE